MDHPPPTLGVPENRPGNAGTEGAMTRTPIVVVGAGVVGLTTTLQLLRAGFTNITVVAKHMPSDRDPAYASPWAGAIFVPVSDEGTREQQWELASWKELFALAAEGTAAGVWLQDKSSFYREDDNPKAKKYDWWKDTVLDYRHLSKADVPEFTDWGIKYRTLALDPDTYLHHLQRQCESLGARFIKREVKHVRDAFLSHTPAHAAIVVNCSGLGARHLGGVEDQTVYPVRGQLVLVENRSNGMYFMPCNDRLGMDRTLGESSYIIERPSGKGTALGGTHTEVGFDELTCGQDMHVAQGIMERAIRVCPWLVPENGGIEGLRVIRHQVGFRPCRRDGPRVELELVDDPDLGVLRVVHGYGVGGFGYQRSYGIADEVVKIVASASSRLH